MTKILLVEDDKSLREIYGVRLLAEGYDIVSAGDGEEALAMAIKERPTLIITDIMMPKISGFDMLDILRSTTETKNIKVIVMTALGSDEQRTRGDQLGADRYLVKSQVGIEDVVRTVHEVLGDKPPIAQTIPAQQPAQPAPQTAQTPAPQPTPRPLAPAAARNTYTQPQTFPTPQAGPPAPAANLQPQPSPQPAPSMSPSAAKSAPPSAVRNRTIQPLNDPLTSRVDINDLLDKELAKEAGIDMNNRPPVATTAQERSIVDDQLKNFSDRPAPAANLQPQPQNPPESFSPTIQIDAQGNVSMQPLGQQPPASQSPQPAPAANQQPPRGIPPTPPPQV